MFLYLRASAACSSRFTLDGCWRSLRVASFDALLHVFTCRIAIITVHPNAKSIAPNIWQQALGGIVIEPTETEDRRGVWTRLCPGSVSAVGRCGLRGHLVSRTVLQAQTARRVATLSLPISAIATALPTSG